MLYFTRWKALAIVLTALIICLCAVPNFFPEAKVKSWPLWAQRHIVLGLDLQGGSYLLLEVDSKEFSTDGDRKTARRAVLADAVASRNSDIAPRHAMMSSIQRTPREGMRPLMSRSPSGTSPTARTIRARRAR